MKTWLEVGDEVEIIKDGKLVRDRVFQTGKSVRDDYFQQWVILESHKTAWIHEGSVRKVEKDGKGKG
jgi:hypothetical protein